MGMKVEQGAAESAAHYAYGANPLPVESKSAAKAA
jgi:alanine-glyoxylate transaminase/serine-glyoxylate transaminase/serine-pyruvate transaminase